MRLIQEILESANGWSGDTAGRLGDGPIIHAGEHEYENSSAHRSRGYHIYIVNFLPLICFTISHLHTNVTTA